MREFFKILTLLSASWLGLTFVLSAVGLPHVHGFTPLVSVLLLVLAAYLTIVTQTSRIEELQKKFDQVAGTPTAPDEQAARAGARNPAENHTQATVQPAPEVSPHAKPAQAPRNPGQEVSINIADETTISELPTIGPILAKRILAERAVRPFSDLDDLAGRCSLMPHQIERIRALVQFELQRKRTGFFSRLFGGRRDQSIAAREGSVENEGKSPGGRVVD